MNNTKLSSEKTMANAHHTQWLVVTDLDGTLLDHHNYNFGPVQETLKVLEQNGIPVIINSSKTASEVEKLRYVLGNKHPFIIENGSGILIPQYYFSRQPEDSEAWHDYWEITLGKPRAQLIKELQNIPPQYQSLYRAFHTLSDEDIMAITDLSNGEAGLANDRHFSEPLYWLGTKTERHDFYHQLHKRHLHFAEAKRFIHIMGHCNKGLATNFLSRLYEQEQPSDVKVVALGDSHNDIDMLKAADVAVVIRSPTDKAPKFEHHCKIISEKFGPEGWTEAIETVFS